MSTAAIDPRFYADFDGLERLKGAARAADPAAIRSAARQFESLFTHMLLKTMRSASLAEGMGDSDETRFYQDMYDQQLSVALSRGPGLGLADLLVEQLTRTGLNRATTPAGATGVTGATGATGAPAAAADALPTAATASRSEFLRALTPWAEAAGRRLGVAPETVLAHAALESGWGRQVPAADGQPSHNLFGIKAQRGWSGTAVSAATTEYDAQGPRRVSAAFRRYDSLAAGVADYAQLLTGSPRYAAALNTGADVAAFATALQRGGYATDPDYASKLVATAATVHALRARDGLKSATGVPTTAGGSAA